jgi:tetrahydrodipicolinate N-succinyltransferase
VDVAVGAGVLLGVAVLVGAAVAVGNGVALGAGVGVGADAGAQANKIGLTSKNTISVRLILPVLLQQSLFLFYSPCGRKVSTLCNSSGTSLVAVLHTSSQSTMSYPCIK